MARSVAYVLASVALAVGIACVAWLITVTAVFSIFNGQNVKSLNLVTPTGGNIDLVAGAGIVVTPNPADSSVEVANAGVITVNSLSPQSGNIVIAATAPGLTLVSSGHTVTLGNGGVTSITTGSGLSASAETGAVMLNNTGVLALGAGTGIAVDHTTGDITVTNTGVVTINAESAVAGDFQIVPGNGLGATSAEGMVTIYDTIVYEASLAKTDANSPTVTYAINIGSITPVTENSWRIGPDVGFPNPFFPGAADTGYGDVGGTSWAVPMGSVGLFAVSVNCEIMPNAIATDDMQTASIAICMGATSEDPFAQGIIPSGGYATLDMSGGANSGTSPALPRQVAISATFQAGCTGCPIMANDALTLHARMDHTGTGVGPYTMTAFCLLTVTHLA